MTEVSVETKPFSTPAVLSAITGILLCDIHRVYEVLTWMTDEPVFTHQLPRVGQEAAPAVVALNPALKQAIAEAEGVTPDNYREWLSAWIDRYGPQIAVPRLNADQHERIDPLSELAEKMHPDRIRVVRP